MALTAPVRYRDVFAVAEFRTLFGVFTLFVVGDSVKMLALSVLVYDRTDSPLAAAVAYMAGMLPYAVGGALFLSLADRLRPRTLLVWFQLIRFAVTAALAACDLPVPVAIALVALTGLFAPVAGAAVNGMLPDLLPGDAFVVGRSLFTMTSAGAQIVGQAVGGALLLAVSPRGALWLATASCLLAAALARFCLRDHPARSGRTGTSAVKTTWRVNGRLLADPVVRGLLLAQWLPISLAVGAEGVVIPYAAGLSRPGAAGVLFAVMASGLLAGNLALGRFANPELRERLALPLALLPGTPLLFFALTPGLTVAALLGAVAALGYSYELGLQRRFLEVVPEAVRGQALGLASTGIMTGQALCFMIAGAVGELLSPGVVMALSGAASIAAALAFARHLRPGRGPGVATPSRPR